MSRKRCQQYQHDDRDDHAHHAGDGDDSRGEVVKVNSKRPHPNTFLIIIFFATIVQEDKFPSTFSLVEDKEGGRTSKFNSFSVPSLLSDFGMVGFSAFVWVSPPPQILS